MIDPRADLASYLQGYVAGYWQGYEFFAHEGVDVDEGASAPGGADASSPAPPLDLPGASRPLTRSRGDGSSSGSATSSLPAIHQGALAPEVEVQVAGQLEAIYVHRGMVTGLRMMAEVFRSTSMFVAASICERAIRGIEIEEVDQP